MKQGFRQSMAWLHTWTGLLVGWLLLLIFMAGTASYYRDEISRWMRPELRLAAVDRTVAAQSALGYLRDKAPKAEQWNVTFPDARDPSLRVFWRNPEATEGSTPGEGGKRGKQGRNSRFGNSTLDPATGRELEVRDTRGGDFLYRLHFDLHYIPPRWARYIVGVCAMFMLVAIITGVITHKKIFKDFFTFRPGKGQRSWLDFHNVSAVLALPYHAMITYTGVVMLMFMYMPWGEKVAYPGDKERFFAEAFTGMAENRPAAGKLMAQYPIRPLLERASAHWNDSGLAGFTVSNPGDANSEVDIRKRESGRLSSKSASVRFDGVSGALLAASPEPAPASHTYNVMYGLHMARFADTGLRALFFLSGLMGCLMVASGVVLWAVKERPKHVKAGRIGFGLRLVDALNIGAVAGLPIAFASYFWANRLVPVLTEERADVEMNMFFIVWSLALLAAFIRPKRVMWAWQLYVSATLFALLPVLNAATTNTHLGITLAQRDWVFAGFDLTMFTIGVVLAYCGWRMHRWQPQVPASQRRRQAPGTASELHDQASGMATP